MTRDELMRRSFCPECGHEAVRANLQTDELGVTHGMYVCGNDHIWETRWIRDKEAA